MNYLSVVFSAITFISTMAGGLIAARFRDRFGVVTAFASGVLIAVPLFDLLPEAHRKNPPLVSLIATLGGFVLIFIITRFLNI